MSFADVAQGSTRHQCVYLKCNRERALMQAQLAATKAFKDVGTAFGATDVYTPHCSLLYSDIDATQRCIPLLEA